MKASAPRSSRQSVDIDRLQAGSASLMTGPSMLGPLARAAAVVLVFAAPAPAPAQQVTTTTYGYDARGNLTTITDPRGKVTTQTFDVLDRMTRQLQPPPSTGGTRPSIGVSYDGLDQVRAVTDPRNLATTYAVDGLGNATRQTSPDTGITNRTFDAAGNLATETDARGKTTTFSYDALNRLTRAAYPTGTATVLEWDGGPSGAPVSRGLLTRITDESGSTAYTYDGFGQVLSKTQTTGTLVRTVRYAYGTTGTATGKLASITYPSGNRVNLAYDTAGRLSSLTLNPTNANGVGTNTASTVTLLSNIAYQPFGAPRAWTWGNGAAYSRTFDLDGRLVNYPLGHPAQGGVVRTVAWDAASRVTGYTHVNGTNVAQPALTQSFGYDDLNRLTTWSAGGRLPGLPVRPHGQPHPPHRGRHRPRLHRRRHQQPAHRHRGSRTRPDQRLRRRRQPELQRHRLVHLLGPRADESGHRRRQPDRLPLQRARPACLQAGARGPRGVGAHRVRS
jgi:YD repeat-containing protein